MESQSNFNIDIRNYVDTDILKTLNKSKREEITKEINGVIDKYYEEKHGDFSDFDFYSCCCKVLAKYNLIQQDMSKKSNMAYWDAIDDVVFCCIREVADYSTDDVTLIFDEEDITEDETTHFCDLYGDGIIGEVRDIIIKYLKENGAKFPFVNKNY